MKLKSISLSSAKVKPISLLFALAVSLSAAGARADARRDVAIHALQQKAQLDPATAERVQQVVDRYHAQLAELRRADANALRELRLLLRDEHPDDKRVKKLSEQLLASRARLAKVKGDRLRDLGKVMTPSQFGRLLVSWRSVNHAIRRAQAIQS
ncbi:MAG TPA: periplasmic heavy metal sensor [Polyangia bacterium]|nr:periplasmic heavy metal sensor [Polyangia bacterium]